MKFHRNGAFAPVPRPITKSDDDNGQRDTGSIDDGSFGGCFVLWHYLQPQQMLFLMLPPLRTCTFDALAHVIRYGAIGQKTPKTNQKHQNKPAVSTATACLCSHRDIVQLW